MRITALQTNALRTKFLDQGIVTLFGKQADREDGRLVSLRTILPEVEFRPPLYKNRERVKSNTSWFQSTSESDVLISPCPWSFRAGLGQDVSYELNKGFSLILIVQLVKNQPARQESACNAGA